MNLTPVAARGGLDALRDPVRVARIGNDQRTIQCNVLIAIEHYLMHLPAAL